MLNNLPPDIMPNVRGKVLTNGLKRIVINCLKAAFFVIS